MDLKQNSINLRLKKIQIADEGEYRCRIDYFKSPTQDYLVNLTVIGKHLTRLFSPESSSHGQFTMFTDSRADMNTGIDVRIMDMFRQIHSKHVLFA